jgi:hypothetical protein
MERVLAEEQTEHEVSLVPKRVRISISGVAASSAQSDKLHDAASRGSVPLQPRIQKPDFMHKFVSKDKESQNPLIPRIS